MEFEIIESTAFTGFSKNVVLRILLFWELFSAILLPLLLPAREVPLLVARVLYLVPELYGRIDLM